MAMPTMHIVEHGSPRLPSGMLYPRGVGQLYMMAGSVELFGESEWAFRLPSALCGVLLILLAYRAGQRFLTPAWNLAFTAAIALLPEFIVDAQTARMYTFLAACVAGYMVLLFEWERSDRVRYLVTAVAVLLLGIHFHTLAVFAAFMTFYPGLVRGQWSKVLLGGVAFAVIVAGFVGMNHWIAEQYPDASETAGGEDGGGSNGARAAAAIPQLGLWFYAAALVVGAALATIVARRVTGVLAAMVTGGALALGLFAQVAFSYHVALRHGDRTQSAAARRDQRSHRLGSDVRAARERCRVSAADLWRDGRAPKPLAVPRHRAVLARPRVAVRCRHRRFALASRAAQAGSRSCAARCARRLGSAAADRPVQVEHPDALYGRGDRAVAVVRVRRRAMAADAA
jgi:hypothetical protein